MTKYFLAAFFIVASAFSVLCQDTISKYEYFQVGDMGNYILPSDTIKTIGQAGAHRTWDYSYLSSTGSPYTVKIVIPASTPYGIHFLNANVAEKNSDSTYNFIQVSADSTKVWGTYNPAFGLDICSVPYTAAVRPISYLDSFSSIDQHQYSVAGSDFKGKGTVKVLADAYGTLKLPNGTYNNVLRIRMEIFENDSAPGIKSYTHVKIYTWFDATHHFSLLKIDSTYNKTGSVYTSTTTDIKYLSSETSAIAPLQVNSVDY